MRISLEERSRIDVALGNVGLALTALSWEVIHVMEDHEQRESSATGNLGFVGGLVDAMIVMFKKLQQACNTFLRPGATPDAESQIEDDMPKIELC